MSNVYFLFEPPPWSAKADIPCEGLGDIPEDVGTYHPLEPLKAALAHLMLETERLQKAAASDKEQTIAEEIRELTQISIEDELTELLEKS